MHGIKNFVQTAQELGEEKGWKEGSVFTQEVVLEDSLRKKKDVQECAAERE